MKRAPQLRQREMCFIEEFIEGNYNKVQLHLALGYKSPSDFES
jgi:hypothetical protein